MLYRVCAHTVYHDILYCVLYLVLYMRLWPWVDIVFSKFNQQVEFLRFCWTLIHLLIIFFLKERYNSMSAYKLYIFVAGNDTHKNSNNTAMRTLYAQRLAAATTCHIILGSL